MKILRKLVIVGAAGLLLCSCRAPQQKYTNMPIATVKPQQPPKEEIIHSLETAIKQSSNEGLLNGYQKFLSGKKGVTEEQLIKENYSKEDFERIDSFIINEIVSRNFMTPKEIEDLKNKKITIGSSKRVLLVLYGSPDSSYTKQQAEDKYETLRYITGESVIGYNTVREYKKNASYYSGYESRIINRQPVYESNYIDLVLKNGIIVEYSRSE